MQLEKFQDEYLLLITIFQREKTLARNEPHQQVKTHLFKENGKSGTKYKN